MYQDVPKIIMYYGLGHLQHEPLNLPHSFGFVFRSNKALYLFTSWSGQRFPIKIKPSNKFRKNSVRSGQCHVCHVCSVRIKRNARVVVGCVYIGMYIPHHLSIRHLDMYLKTRWESINKLCIICKKSTYYLYCLSTTNGTV